MSDRIVKLTLRHFRGATVPAEIIFDPKKPLVMIYGENGSGKSTIIDAIDIVCNRKIGTFDHRSGAGNQHLPSLGRSSHDLSVTLQAGDSSWSAHISKSNVVLGESKTSPPPAAILRRSRMLRLIEAQPGERYKELQQFIDVAAIEKCEQSLRKAVVDAETNTREGIRVADSNRNSIDKLWEEAGNPAEDSFTWASSVAQRDSGALEVREAGLSRLLEGIAAVEQAKEMLDTNRAYTVEYQAALIVVQTEISVCAAELVETEGDAIKLLHAVDAYLNQHPDGDRCPVCEQPAELDKLRSRISSRLEAMNKLSDLHGREEERQRIFSDSVRATEKASEGFRSAARRLAITLRNSLLAGVKKLGLDWTSYEELLDEHPDDGAAELSPEWENQATSLLQFMAPHRENLEKHRQSVQHEMGMAVALRVLLLGLAESQAELKIAHSVELRLKQTLSVVEEERKKYVRGVLEQVQGECNRLYAVIHPGEKIGGFQLVLDENKRASLSQKAVFGISDVAPQAYYSEAHLDTLGFCLFLAVAQRAADNDGVLVLDDVFTSVDDEHLDRIAQLLVSLSNCFRQIIVSTHSRKWRDMFTRHHIVQPECHVLELLPWSFDRGIRTYKTRLAIEEMRDLMKAEPMDRQSVAGKAGVLMESVLDSLTLQYRSKMPRHPKNMYTLGELLDGISNDIKKLKLERDDAEIIGTSLHELHKDLKDFLAIRNTVGGHFNPTGYQYTEAEVRQYGELAVQFLEALACSHCGEIPRNNKTTYLACRCGKTRLSPPPGKGGGDE